MLYVDTRMFDTFSLAQMGHRVRLGCLSADSAEVKMRKAIDAIPGENSVALSDWSSIFCDWLQIFESCCLVTKERRQGKLLMPH